MHGNGPVLDEAILARPEVQKAIETCDTATVELPIANTDRCLGGRIAGTLARLYGDTGFARQGGLLDLRFVGSAGQSFGAFTLAGMRLTLTGKPTTTWVRACVAVKLSFWLPQKLRGIQQKT